MAFAHLGLGAAASSCSREAGAARGTLFKQADQCRVAGGYAAATEAGRTSTGSGARPASRAPADAGHLQLGIGGTPSLARSRNMPCC